MEAGLVKGFTERALRMLGFILNSDWTIGRSFLQPGTPMALMVNDDSTKSLSVK